MSIKCWEGRLYLPNDEYILEEEPDNLLHQVPGPPDCKHILHSKIFIEYLQHLVQHLLNADVGQDADGHQRVTSDGQQVSSVVQYLVILGYFYGCDEHPNNVKYPDQTCKQSPICIVQSYSIRIRNYCRMLVLVYLQQN